MEAVPSITELFPAPESTAKKANSPDELGQEDFMTLMVAQLENQDPTKPMDNFQFLSQLAQFGTVNGIQDLQTSLGSLSSALLSNQALQAANLVGRDVVTGSNTGVLPAEGEVNADIALPAAADNLTLYVQDMTGRLVLAQPIGAVSAGDLKVRWDGTNNEGELMPPGEYRFSAEALIGGQNRAVDVFAHSRVESVNVDPSGFGVQLNLAGGAQVGIADVKQIL